MWIIYTVVLGFAAYWASNLLLWFPWSYSTTLGVTLMLTAAPFLWTYTIYLALKTYSKTQLMKGAFIVAFIFLVLAVVMDYIFFGIIRNAMEELYQPTTFYGYGFLIALPFIVVLILKKKILAQKTKATNTDIIIAGVSGLICLSALTLIIVLGIEI